MAERLRGAGRFLNDRRSRVAARFSLIERHADDPPKPSFNFWQRAAERLAPAEVRRQPAVIRDELVRKHAGRILTFQVVLAAMVVVSVASPLAMQAFLDGVPALQSAGSLLARMPAVAEPFVGSFVATTMLRPVGYLAGLKCLHPLYDTAARRANQVIARSAKVGSRFGDSSDFEVVHTKVDDELRYLFTQRVMPGRESLVVVIGAGVCLALVAPWMMIPAGIIGAAFQLSYSAARGKWKANAEIQNESGSRARRQLRTGTDGDAALVVGRHHQLAADNLRTRARWLSAVWVEARTWSRMAHLARFASAAVMTVVMLGMALTGGTAPAVAAIGSVTGLALSQLGLVIWNKGTVEASYERLAKLRGVDAAERQRASRFGERDFDRTVAAPSVEWRNVRVALANGRVIGEGSFTAKGGRSVAILAENGVGKSTYLQHLLGLVPDATGEVIFHRQDGSETVPVRQLSERALYGMVQGFSAAGRRAVPQQFGSFDADASADGDVTFRLRSGPDVDEAFELASVTPEMRAEYVRQVNEKGVYSGSEGQHERWSIAGALLAPPGSVTVFDEPAANTDPFATERIAKAIRGLENRTRVVVTHRVELALACDDVVVLGRDGRLVQQGTPRKVFTTPGSLGEQWADATARLINSTWRARDLFRSGGASVEDAFAALRSRNGGSASPSIGPHVNRKPSKSKSTPLTGSSNSLDALSSIA